MIYTKIYLGKLSLKYLNSYKDDEEVKPLYILLPKMSEYVNSFDGTSTCLMKMSCYKNIIKCRITSVKLF